MQEWEWKRGAVVWQGYALRLWLVLDRKEVHVPCEQMRGLVDFVVDIVYSLVYTYRLTFVVLHGYVMQLVL